VKQPASLRAGELVAGLMLLALSVAVGCRSTGKAERDEAIDLPLAKQSRHANEAFHDGYDDLAVSRYRLALRRAWEIDDSDAIANTAFNLAACWAAMREYEPARQALAEARAELRRSGQSEVDAWLLEAKIARAQGRIDDAAYFADCVVEPMIRRDPQCLDKCGKKAGKTTDASGAMSRLQRCRQRLAECCGHEEPEPDICEGYEVSLALFRANLALDRGDIPAGRAELARARRSPLTLEDAATRAEVAAVDARLLLLVQRPVDAARRLDDEARWLRESGHLRELPMATSAAAEAFLQAGMMVEASERFFRTARLLYGRSDLLAALYFLGRSIELAVATGDVDLQMRTALLLEEIERANRKQKSGDAVAPEELDAIKAGNAGVSATDLDARDEAAEAVDLAPHRERPSHPESTPMNQEQPLSLGSPGVSPNDAPERLPVPSATQN